MGEPSVVIFGDFSNGYHDPEYHLLVVEAFREMTGWDVAEGTRIWEEIKQVAKGFVCKKRDPVEVAGIVWMAIQPELKRLAEEKKE